MKDTHLLIVCGALESGGAERVISILSTPFANTFDHVTILTWRDAPIFYEIDPRVEIVSLRKLSHSNNNIRKIHTFRKYLKQKRPDIILSFLTLFNLFSLISSFRLKIPIIVAERNDPNFLKGGFIMKLIRNTLYRSSDGILCQTQSIQNYFKGSLRKKTHIIYNPITLPKDYIGKALSTPKKKRIVSVGRLHPQKNQKLLINAFTEFYKEHPDYELIIYGTGPLKEELINEISRLKMENHIILAGEQKDIKDLILEAETFVMTSNYEGMPNALIEAMCLGLPCISTKVSGAVDLIKNKENGILVESDISEIASAMSEMIDQPNTSKNIAKNATYLYDLLNINKISRQWIDYLRLKL